MTARAKGDQPRLPGGREPRTRPEHGPRDCHVCGRLGERPSGNAPGALVCTRHRGL